MDKNLTSSFLEKKFNLILNGCPTTVISSISSIESPKPYSLIFLSDKRFIEKNNFPENCFFLVSDKLAATMDASFNYLTSIDIWQKFSEISLFFKQKKFSNINNEPFLNGENITIGSNCSFGVNVILESNVSIGDNTIINNNVVIGANCIIGDNAFIDSGCVIGSEGFGNHRKDDGSWIHIHHTGSVIIHKDVSIGSNCCIDRGTIDNTIINRGVIIDNLVHIAHNVEIGEYTAIAAKTGIAGSCKIGKRNLIGGMVGIVDHIKTTDDVVISATSTVNKDIEESGIYTGIMPITQHVTWKRVALWISKLDKIAKSLNFKKYIS